MASYKPYEINMTSKTCEKKLRLPDNGGEKTVLHQEDFINHRSQEAINISAERTPYLMKNEGNPIPFNYERNFNSINVGNFSGHELTDPPPPPKAEVQAINEFPQRSDYQPPKKKSYMDYQMPMLDLETASKNIIKNLDSDDDIEKETENILGKKNEIVKMKNDKINAHNTDQNINNIINVCKENVQAPSKDIANSQININQGDVSHSIPFQLTREEAQAMFSCPLCEVGFQGLRDWIEHIKAEHSHIQLPDNFEGLLYKQRRTILGVERTAVDLLSINKFKAVTRLLTSSKENLEYSQIDIFNNGNINVFRKFLLAMYTRIENLMKKKLEVLKRTKPKKKYSRFNIDSLQPMVRIENFDIFKHIKKDSKKVDIIKIKRKNIDRASVSSGFSSDDDICLKDSILKERENKHPRWRDTLDENSNLNDLNIKEKCISFYAVPERIDGKPMSFFDRAAVRQAVQDISSGKYVHMDLFKHIRIMRYERETGEHLKDDVLFIGYSSKKNGRKYKPKPFSDIFNIKGRLNDKTRSHGKRDAESTSSLSEQIIESEDEKEDILTNEEDTKDDIMTVIDDSGTDDFDDGFESATAHLIENREAICVVCNSTFATKKLLKTHVLLHHTPEWEKKKDEHIDSSQLKHACITCGECFSQKGRLLEHELKMHQSLKQHNCGICQAGFPTVFKRDKHLLTHSTKKPKPIRCGFCLSIFEDYIKLREHFEAAHPDGGNVKIEHDDDKDIKIDLDSMLTMPMNKKTVKFDKKSADAPQCDICSRKFTSLGRLQQHTAVSHQDVAFRKDKRKAKKLYKTKDVCKTEDIEEFIETNS